MLDCPKSRKTWVLGGGGSILTVPIFVYVLDLGTKEAIAMSLADIYSVFQGPTKVIATNLEAHYAKEAAISAGLEHARGQAVVPMDVDMQDPPEVLVEMVEKWRAAASKCRRRSSSCCAVSRVTTGA